MAGRQSVSAPAGLAPLWLWLWPLISFLLLLLPSLLLPLLLLPRHNESPTRTADPEGAAHGCAAFFDRAMDGESKNPGTDEGPDVLRRGDVFLLFRFFWRLPKEMNSAAPADESVRSIACGEQEQKQCFLSPAGERLTFLCWPKEK